MREIRVKAQIRSIKKFKKAIADIDADFSEPIKQHDRFFRQFGSDYESYGSILLFIRIENDQKSTLIFKRAIIGQLDDIRHETEIKNVHETELVLKELRYELYAEVIKIRRKLKINKTEICFDEVPGLGVFVEAGKVIDNDVRHDAVVKGLWELLQRLGIERKDEVEESYDVLQRRQLYKHS